MKERKIRGHKIEHTHINEVWKNKFSETQSKLNYIQEIITLKQITKRYESYIRTQKYVTPWFVPHSNKKNYNVTNLNPTQCEKKDIDLLGDSERNITRLPQREIQT